MGSMCCIYKKKNFKIYDVGNNDYIVHNTKLDFKNHHTHLRNFHTCKFIIDLSIHKSIPKSKISDYLIISLIRLSNDNVYINNLKRLLKNKGGKYERNS